MIHDPIDIRSAVSADLDRLFLLWSQMQYPHVDYHPQYYHMANDEVVELATRRHFLGMMEDENTAILVAEIHGTIAGYCVASINDRPPVFVPTKQVLIQQAIVAPDLRGQGVFSRLHSAVIDWGKSRGATQAELMVDSKNPALGVYEAMGYCVVQHKMTLELSAQQGDPADTQPT